MTQRQIAFANQYIATGNATEAYRQCYPKARAWKAATVHVAACRLLRNTKVRTRVAELQDQADASAVMSRTEVLEILSRIIRACISDFLRVDGTVDVDAVRRARQELEVVVIEKTPDGRRRVRIKFSDRLAAIDRMARMQGWYRPQQVEVATTNTEGMASLRAMFETMTPAERAAWLDANLGSASAR